MFALALRRHGSWFIPLLVATGVSLISGYYTNDKALTNRMTASEVRQGDDRDDLRRLESKLDKVDAKTDRIYEKLIEWERAK